MHAFIISINITAEATVSYHTRRALTKHRELNRFKRVGQYLTYSSHFYLPHMGGVITLIFLLSRWISHCVIPLSHIFLPYMIFTSMDKLYIPSHLHRSLPFPLFRQGRVVTPYQLLVSILWRRNLGENEVSRWGADGEEEEKDLVRKRDNTDFDIHYLPLHIYNLAISQLVALTITVYNSSILLYPYMESCSSSISLSLSILRFWNSGLIQLQLS